jgi:hypothetical protein
VTIMGTGAAELPSLTAEAGGWYGSTPVRINVRIRAPALQAKVSGPSITVDIRHQRITLKAA